jgi:hypothetical protein
MQAGPEFTFLIDDRWRVLLARCGRSFTPEGMDAFVVAARAFAAKYGNWTGIVDFTQVRDIGVNLEYVRTLAQRPRVMRGAKRVLVAPQSELFGMLRLYGLHQAGLDEDTMVVRSIEEAYAWLGLKDPEFHPLDLG